MIYSKYYLNVLKRNRGGFFVEAFDLQKSQLVLLRKRMWTNLGRINLIGVVIKLKLKDLDGGFVSVFNYIVDNLDMAKHVNEATASRFETDKEMNMAFNGFINYELETDETVELIYKGVNNNYELS